MPPQGSTLLPVRHPLQAVPLPSASKHCMLELSRDIHRAPTLQLRKPMRPHMATEWSSNTLRQFIQGVASAGQMPRFGPTAVSTLAEGVALLQGRFSSVLDEMPPDP